MPLDLTPVPTGPEFIVDAATAHVRFNPAAAALAGGGFVVVRHDSVQLVGGSRPVYTDGDVRAQLYAADGTPAGGEFLVNDYRTDHQYSPRVAALADGGFAVTWASTKQGVPNTSDVYVRRFAADGTPAGDEIRVHDALGGSQTGAEITALADGGFVVTWSGPPPSAGGVRGIYARRFDADGTPAGSEVRFDDAFGGFQGLSDVAVLADGSFAVALEQGDRFITGDTDVHVQRFGADGAAVGEGFRVHSSPNGSQKFPQIATLADGGFVVTWNTRPLDRYTEMDVYARRFAADGTPAGEEFRVHDSADGYQANPGAWSVADGRFAITWYDSDLREANGLGVYARYFDAPGVPGPPAAPSKAQIVAGVASRAEGDAGATATFSFDVTLDAAPSVPQSVRWQVEGRGTRPADAADFSGGALPSGELVFAAGETRKTIAVHVAGDAVVEGNEGFAVSLRAPSGGLAVGAHGSAAATILDDDLPASAPPAHAAKVMRLYDAALDRLPDRGGFEFWVGALQKGEALSSLASGFLSSDEFAARFGDASSDDAAFVERLYQNVLGRAGEAEGRSFWCDSLGEGSARAEVLAAFSESAEHVALTADLHGDGAGLLIA